VFIKSLLLRVSRYMSLVVMTSRCLGSRTDGATYFTARKCADNCVSFQGTGPGVRIQIVGVVFPRFGFVLSNFRKETVSEDVILRPVQTLASFTNQFFP